MLHLLSARVTIDEPAIQEFMYELCSAVQYMHNRGIVHRDLV